jgi:hypothetical protein
MCLVYRDSGIALHRQEKLREERNYNRARMDGRLLQEGIEQEMSNATIGMICIKVKRNTMRIGPFTFDENLSNTFIENEIYEALLEHGYDFYGVDDVDDIVVVFVNDDYDGIYSPNIEDVWPRVFGHRQAIEREQRKEGEK